MGSGRKINLVLAGGGIKVCAYIGALKAFEERNIEIERVASVSSGSFVGLAAVIGYTASELEQLVLETDFTKFAGSLIRRAARNKIADIKSKFPHVKKLTDKLKEHIIYEILSRKFGISDGQEIIDWTADILKSKNFSPYATFGDLPKDLRIVVYDYTNNAEIVFSREKTPEAEVVNAIRASTSLAVIYQPVKWVSPQGQALLLTDGGYINPFPIEIFKDEENRLGYPRTLGLKTIGEKREVPQNSNSFLDYMVNHMMCAFDNQDIIHVKRRNWRRTIGIPVGTIRTTEFIFTGNDKQQKSWLVQQGYDADSKYLNYWGNLLFAPEPIFSTFFEIKSFLASLRK